MDLRMVRMALKGTYEQTSMRIARISFMGMMVFFFGCGRRRCGLRSARRGLQLGECADRIRERLQQEHREAQRDEGLQQVAHGNAAGVRRAFADAPRLHHVEPAEVDDERRDEHEGGCADELDPRLHPLGIGREEDVDPHMLAMPEGVGHADQTDRRQQMPLQFLRPDRAEREEIAEQHVRRHDEHEQEGRPREGAADQIGETVDPVGEPERRRHEARTLEW